MVSPTTTPVVAIVDGYSSGNFLPAAFARLGVATVHVQSSAELMPSMLAPDLSQYRENHVSADTAGFARTAKALDALGVTAVLAGQEPGVPLADALSERLGLASNGSALSRARRDKHEMIETLRAAGVRCARQFKSADVAAVTEWAEQQGEYPVVVKPLSSASTDNVSICHSASDVAAAARQVLAARDIFDLPNNEALVQSYLHGTEYIVDTVSVDGQMYAVGVWEYEKTIVGAGKKIYDRDVLLDSDAAPVPELIAYVRTVLDALGIRNGPAHAEVMMTPQGPALVEVGARLNGNMNPDLHNICLGTNQADLIALAYARPQEFLERFGDRVYDKHQEAVVHNTSTVVDGEVESVNQAAVDKIATLPTVHLISVKYGPGKRIQPTVDLLTSPLRIFMTGTDHAALRADYRVIQDIKDEVYVVRPTA